MNLKNTHFTGFFVIMTPISVGGGGGGGGGMLDLLWQSYPLNVRLYTQITSKLDIKSLRLQLKRPKGMSIEIYLLVQ